MNDPSRTLVLVRIVHSEADMGALGEKLRKASLRRVGRYGLERKRQAVERLWDAIEDSVSGLETDFSRVRLYQDGLPVCGAEKEIVTSLARSGSRNHRLLLQLAERGATIMGTESPELLKAEYERVRELFAADGRTASAEPDDGGLLRRRDEFIAARINGTLQGGETGVLFIGALHRLDGYLDSDIDVRRIPEGAA